MPYFVDPGRSTTIKNITDQPDKYEPINAYDYLKWRLAQSHDSDYVSDVSVAQEGEKHLPKYERYI